MKIENHSSFVEFEFKELYNIQGRRDVACRIKVFFDGFAGEINDVYFSREDINSFLEELEAFDKTRKGAIELLNMSSGSEASPLEFKIFATDGLGHLAVRAILRKLVYLKDSYEISNVSVAFEIDAGSLASIIRDFKKLFIV